MRVSMREAVTYDQLKVKCKLKFTTLYHFELQVEANEHIKAIITGIVKMDQALNLMQNGITEETIEIVKVDDKGKDKLSVFRGLIQCAELTKEGGFALISIQAASATWSLDTERKKRSFQNVEKTYKEIIETILKDYKGAAMIWKGNDRQIGKPFIQYQETDWEFIKRLTSHLNLAIYPETASGTAKFYVGLREGENKGTLSTEQYAVGLHDSYDPIACKRAGKSRKEFIVRKTAELPICKIGDLFTFQGVQYPVCGLHVEIKDGILQYTGVLASESCLARGEVYNRRLKGKTFLGTVIDTQQETIKIQLDMDCGKEQNAGRTYDYPWRPRTGNLLYCMPEKGTRAALYIMEEDERRAEAIYSMHSNADNSSERQDCENRCFTTAGGKRMYLEPTSTGFLSMNKRMELSINDGRAVSVRASSKISIMAEQLVELKANKITFTTPTEATLVRKDLLKPTVINLCNAFDAIGSAGGFASNGEPVKESERKSSEEKKSEPYHLNGVILPMLTSIPVEIGDDDAMNMAIGSMPVIGGRG